MSTKPYELGMNCAGETAGQVANYIIADLRVYLKGQPVGTQLLDDAGERIYKACREAALAGRQPLLAALLMQNAAAADSATARLATLPDAAKGVTRETDAQAAAREGSKP